MATAFIPPAADDDDTMGTIMVKMPIAKLRKMTVPVCMSLMLRRAMDMLDEVKDAELARHGRVAESRTAVLAARMPIWKEMTTRLS